MIIFVYVMHVSFINKVTYSPALSECEGLSPLLLFLSIIWADLAGDLCLAGSQTWCDVGWHAPTSPPPPPRCCWLPAVWWRLELHLTACSYPDITSLCFSENEGENGIKAKHRNTIVCRQASCREDSNLCRFGEDKSWSAENRMLQGVARQHPYKQTRTVRSLIFQLLLNYLKICSI